MSLATGFLLGQGPSWHLIFPRRKSPGLSLPRRGVVHQMSEYAFLVLDVVIRALRAHADQEAVRSMLLAETETLLDRLELVKVELQLALVPTPKQYRMVLDVLLTTRMLISLAVATGDLRDVIYLQASPTCPLFEYLGEVTEQLRGLVGDLPAAKEAAHG